MLIYILLMFMKGGEPGVGDFDIDGPGLVITAEFSTSTGNTSRMLVQLEYSGMQISMVLDEMI